MPDTKPDSLSWTIRLRDAAVAAASGLPSEIRTVAPSFRHPDLPDEVALLLPNSGSREATPLRAAGRKTGDIACGLFVADPFLSTKREVRAFRDAGVRWVANLPSIQQQDVEFEQQLDDVGINVSLEARMLRIFAGDGMRVIAVVADTDGIQAFLGQARFPDAFVVMPRVGDFAAGFPSMRQRGSAAAAIADRLAVSDWQGPLLMLGTSQEAEHPFLWPEAIHGLLCRPEPAAPRQVARP